MGCDALIRCIHPWVHLKTACCSLSRSATPRFFTGRSEHRRQDIRMESASNANGSADTLATHDAKKKVLLVVAAALIDPHSKTVLLAERPSKKHLEGLFEFPGGKVEPLESPEEALVRELKEELGICVKEDNLEPLTFASHGYEEKGFHLLMPLYVCTKWEGNPEGKEQQKLVWCSKDDLNTYPMPPADYPLIGPLTHYMDALFSKTLTSC